jgi:hypothetical protein
MKRYFFLTAILIYSFSFNAQVVPDRDNDFDKKYTPGPNSPFNSRNNNSNSSSSSEVTFKNAIKFCPTMIFRQKVGFYYERQVTKGFSFTGGLGKAFGPDIFEQLYFQEFSVQYDENVMNTGEMYSNSEYKGSSPFFSLGIKVYYSGNVFEDGYIEFMYRRERVDYTLKPQSMSVKVEGSTALEFQVNSFSFGIGHIFNGGTNGKMTHEIFWNMGVKYFQVPKFDVVQVPSYSYYGSTEPIYRRSQLTMNARILPSMSFGYIFGFGF